MKKKVMGIILSFVMIFAMIPASAMAYGQLPFDTDITLSTTTDTWNFSSDGDFQLTFNYNGTYYYATIMNEYGSEMEEIEMGPDNYKPIYSQVLPAGEYKLKARARNSASTRMNITYSVYNPNKTPETAADLDVPLGTSTTPESVRLTAIGDGEGGGLWYKLVVKDKAYYSFEAGEDHETFTSVYGFTAKQIAEGELNQAYAIAWETVGYNINEEVLDKGTYYIRFGVTSGRKMDMTVKCRDFNDIKKLTPEKSTITSDTSSKLVLLMNASPVKLPIGTVLEDWEKSIYGDVDYTTLGYESTIRWSCNKSSGYEFEKARWDCGKIFVPYKAGIYKVTATTSEGVKGNVTIKIAPSKYSYKNVSSVGNTKSSTISWAKLSNGANYYKLYQKKNGKFVKVWGGTSLSHKVTGLKANKTYEFKISACYKTGSTILEGPKSDTFKVVTAPSAKAKINSAKCSSNKYVPSKKQWQVGHWNGSTWFPGHYFNTTAYTISKIKVKVKKISGASYYQYNGATNWASPSGPSKLAKTSGTIEYWKTGKVSGSKKVKVRAVKANSTYNSVAYGPWSSTKSVKLKRP